MPDEVVRAEVDRWWQYAIDDLASAELLLTSLTAPARHACLHAQQAAEKALKCLLISQELPMPRVHDLGFLQRLLPSNMQAYALSERDLNALSHWAVESRYPGVEDDADSHDAETAIATAQCVLEAVEADLTASGFIHS